MPSHPAWLQFTFDFLGILWPHFLLHWVIICTFISCCLVSVPEIATSSTFYSLKQTIPSSTPPARALLSALSAHLLPPASVIVTHSLCPCGESLQDIGTGTVCSVGTHFRLYLSPLFLLLFHSGSFSCCLTKSLSFHFVCLFYLRVQVVNSAYFCFLKTSLFCLTPKQYCHWV